MIDLLLLLLLLLFFNLNDLGLFLHLDDLFEALLFLHIPIGDSQERGFLAAALGLLGYLPGLTLLWLGLFDGLPLGLLRWGGGGIALPREHEPEEPRRDRILELADLDVPVLDSRRLELLDKSRGALDCLLRGARPAELDQPLEQSPPRVVVVLRVDVILVERTQLARLEVVHGTYAPLGALLACANLFLTLGLLVAPALLVLGSRSHGLPCFHTCDRRVVRVRSQSFHIPCGRGLDLGLCLHGLVSLCFQRRRRKTFVYSPTSVVHPGPRLGLLQQPRLLLNLRLGLLQ